MMLFTKFAEGELRKSASARTLSELLYFNCRVASQQAYTLWLQLQSSGDLYQKQKIGYGV